MNEAMRFLMRNGAPQELRRFAENCDTLASLWERVPRPDWLLWLVGTLEEKPRPELRSFACWCARRFWPRYADRRSKEAIDIAERYAKGEAMSMELQMAAAAAKKAADDSAAMGDHVAAMYAFVAHSVTLPRSVDAAAVTLEKSMELVRLGLLHLDQTNGSTAAAQLRYADQLREFMKNPFVVTTMRPNLQFKMRRDHTPAPRHVTSNF